MEKQKHLIQNREALLTTQPHKITPSPRIANLRHLHQRTTPAEGAHAAHQSLWKSNTHIINNSNKHQAASKSFALFTQLVQWGLLLQPLLLLPVCVTEEL